MIEASSDIVLDQKAAAALLYTSVKSLQRWREHGTGPRYARGPRRVYYLKSDVLAWLNSRKHDSLAAEARAA